MEAVGFVSSLFTIVQVAETAARLCAALYEIARESKSVHNRAIAAAIQIESCTTSIRTAHVSLQHRCPMNSNSPVICYLVRHRTLSHLKQESKHVRKLIRRPREKIQNLSGTFDFIASWKWRGIKPKLDTLFIAFTSLKTNMILIQNAVHLELVLAERENALQKDRQTSPGGKTAADLQAEVELLKDVIAEQIKTIQRLRENAVGTSAPASNNGRVIPGTRPADRPDDQVILCHLAQSLIQNERAPESSPRSFSFSARSSGMTSSPSHGPRRVARPRPKGHSSTGASSRASASASPSTGPSQGPSLSPNSSRSSESIVLSDDIHPTSGRPRQELSDSSIPTTISSDAMSKERAEKTKGKQKEERTAAEREERTEERVERTEPEQQEREQNARKADATEGTKTEEEHRRARAEARRKTEEKRKSKRRSKEDRRTKGRAGVEGRKNTERGRARWERRGSKRRR